MFARKSGRSAAILALAVLALTCALTLAPPLRAARVVTTRLTAFSGTSEKGSFEEALEAAIHHAASASPLSDRPTEWKVVRIAGTSGGAKPLTRVVVTVEARW